jgi:ribosomal protein S25
MPEKKSLSQMEKQQFLREKKAKGRREDRKGLEKRLGSIEIPVFDEDELLDLLKRMRAITPQGFADRLNLRVSVAKRFLEELREKGVIELVDKSHDLVIYRLQGS